MRAALARVLLPASARLPPAARRAPCALPRTTPARAATHCSMAPDAAPLTLNESLRGGRAALAGSGPLTLVLGNEAADLDSIACALGYAALLRACGDAGAAAVVGVPRADLRLRTETAWLLAQHGVDVDALAFADDVDMRALAAQGRLQRAVLVDHNRLSGSVQEAVAPRVAVIVDHHVDEQQFPDAEKDIQLVGSCSSLVTAHIARRAPALLEDEALRTVLLGAVLLDTGNLTGQSSRIAAVDHDAVALLSRGAPTAELYNTLLAKRFDQSGLSSLDLLRRDYKEWVMGGWRVGVAAVGLPLAEIVARADDPLDAALSRWRAERTLDFLIVMTAHNAGGAFRRELGLSAQGVAAVALLPQLGKALSTSQLALDPLPLPPPGWPAPGDAFVQRDVKASRKVVQPLLVAFFDKPQHARADA